MKVLLISTYELGHQPLHIAAPAAELREAGHDVSALDLAIDSWDSGCLEGIDAVAVSVPMHTAMRMAIEVGKKVKDIRAATPVALYGLYAAVGSDRTLGVVADRLICGEYDDALVAWVGSLAGAQPGRGVTVEIGRRRFIVPARDVLPPLDRYAHLATAAGHDLVGYVEASHGCRHRCTHCPVPAVYDGRYRITGADTVLADIDQLVDLGARHVTFGDPDFLNAPAYATGVITAAHQRHPELTFDITVKVEHVLEHRHLWPALSGNGVVFVVSAVESLDQAVLEHLDKGHSPAEANQAVDVLRSAGIELHPTWLPFTPWTTAESVADIAAFVWRHDLAPVTDPVQLSIRLLIPDGSLLLAVDALTPHLTGYDADALGYTWRARDPAMDELQSHLARLAEEGISLGTGQRDTLTRMTEAIAAAAGIPIPMEPESTGPPDRPRLSEPWFCCAEPTGSQLDALSLK
ncbi:CUAEP/CCAEP-tail radical SAM protein [soil metagenome]